MEKNKKSKLKIILTACGCPGASTLIRMLKNNGEREIEIVGVDMDEQAVGKFLVDRFYKIPGVDDPNYLSVLIDIAKKEKPDVLFPESSYEVYPLSLNRNQFEQLGVKVVVSDPEPIEIANNKFKMYEVLREKTNLSLPQYCSPNNLEEFIDCAYKLGYPKKAVCFKPHIGKGSRGFRFIDPSVSRKDLLLNHKPNNRHISLEEFIAIFKEEKRFPKLLLQEKVEGREYTTDPIAFKGEMFFCTTKTVESARWGVIVKGQLVSRPDLVEQSRQILKAIPLSYNVNLQFIEDKLIEINPRVSSFIYQEELIAPYLAIKLILGEATPEEMRSYQTGIKYGRRMLRYMDQIFWNVN